ncbi:MAG: 4Fe-4S binding protein [Desulfomonile tiedjei]|nr:4Fe-4S binding protein [Desulfomonile tiedjei]
MESRRSFLMKWIMCLIAFATTYNVQAGDRESQLKGGRKINKALVLWYSQTGHTKIHGRLIAHVWEKLGLNVVASEVREFDKRSINDFDLILIGTPVFYYDIPGYVSDWIKSLPSLDGIPVASFVTYGGPEGDQHNAACTTLELLAEKGGVPVGMRTFMNMGTMPTVWSDEHVPENLWNNRHLPNEQTYSDVRSYASFLVEQVKQGNHIRVHKQLTLRRMVTFLGPIWWTKLTVSKHTIDKDKCTKCGTCQSKCPVRAIDPVSGHVDKERCVLCFGCLNNCPAQAIVMEYGGRKLFGFWELLRRKGITIKEPEELRHANAKSSGRENGILRPGKKCSPHGQG